MVPIENTLAGSVHENYDHLLNFELPIVAETSVRIVHNLIAPQGVPFSKIRRVFSHPVALESVPGFLRRQSADRAHSVLRYGGQRQDGHRGGPDRRGAAIASSVAAEIYGGGSCGAPSRATGRTSRASSCCAGRNSRAGIRSARPIPARVEDFAGLQHPQYPGGPVPRVERFRPARSQPDEDRIPPSARQALGVSVLPGFPGTCGFAQCAERPEPFRELADFLRVLGCYPKGA